MGCSGRSRSPPKRVVVIRHGQADHNIDHAASGKRNSQLTEKGRLQCAVARERFASSGVEVVLTSPLLRCLQTTANLGASVPVVVVPDLRECWVDGSYQCEAPLEPHAASSSGVYSSYDWSMALEAEKAAALAAEKTGGTENSKPPSKAPSVDTSVWHGSKGGMAAGEPSAFEASPLSAWERSLLRADARSSWLGNAVGLQARAKRLTEYVRSRPEKIVGVVSHAAFLDLLTSDAALGRMANCEVRVYTLMPRGGWMMPWQRVEKLPAPTTAELVGVPMSPRSVRALEPIAEVKGDAGEPSPAASSVSMDSPSASGLSLADGAERAVSKATEGKVRGGAMPGMASAAWSE